MTRLNSTHRDMIISIHQRTRGSGAQISRTTGLKERSIQRVLLRYHQTGSPHPIKSDKMGRPRKLRGVDIAFIESMLDLRPDWHIEEIREELRRGMGVEIVDATITRALRRRGYTRVQLSKTAAERDENARNAWRLRYGDLYQPDHLVFADESHCNRQTPERRWGWCLRGQRARRQTFFVRGQKFSMLPAMSSQGILHLNVFDRPVTAEDFNLFVLGLLDHMNPFPLPKSVIVIDNASIHHSPYLRPMVEARGMRLEYLPAYSPDLNPIEEAFSSIKAWIRSQGEYARGELGARGRARAHDFLYRAVFSVGAINALAWVRNSGYN